MSDKVLSQTANAVRKREARARAAGVMTLAVEPAAEVVAVPDVVIEAAIAEIEQGKTFTFVGWAYDTKGRGAVRYTNDKRRSGTLLRGGFTAVKFIPLPRAMTKDEIIAQGFAAQVTPPEAQVVPATNQLAA